MNWRPIETAPKNQRILARVTNQYWITEIIWWDLDDLCWVYGEQENACTPTHWMPLPPPPSTEPAPHDTGEFGEPWGHDLWKHLHDEHSLMLLESELQQIVRKSVPLVSDLSQVVVVKKEAVEEIKCFLLDISLTFAGSILANLAAKLQANLNVGGEE
jgi:hypothetical protein